MSKSIPPPRLRPVDCQLPMSWYFDAEIFEREKRLLFDAGPYQSPMEDTMVHFHEWLRRGLERK